MNTLPRSARITAQLVLLTKIRTYGVCKQIGKTALAKSLFWTPSLLPNYPPIQANPYLSQKKEFPLKSNRRLGCVLVWRAVTPALAHRV